jgi:hypothetical protein
VQRDARAGALPSGRSTLGGRGSRRGCEGGAARRSRGRASLRSFHTGRVAVGVAKGRAGSRQGLRQRSSRSRAAARNSDKKVQAGAIQGAAAGVAAAAVAAAAAELVAKPRTRRSGGSGRRQVEQPEQRTESANSAPTRPARRDKTPPLGRMKSPVRRLSGGGGQRRRLCSAWDGGSLRA